MKTYQEALDAISKLESKRNRIKDMTAEVGQMYLDHIREHPEEYEHPQCYHHWDNPIPENAKFSCVQERESDEGKGIRLMWSAYACMGEYDDGEVLIPCDEYEERVQHFWELISFDEELAKGGSENAWKVIKTTKKRNAAKLEFGENSPELAEITRLLDEQWNVLTDDEINYVCQNIPRDKL